MHDTEQKVYVVDDDPDIRSALSRALGKRGMAVETYGSAQAFLDAYDGETSGCLVLDYGLPKMSGLDLQDRLNELRYPLAVIFITGHGGVPESVRAMKAGAVDFLEKPFRQAVLAELVEKALQIASEKSRKTQRNSGIKARFDRLTVREGEIVAHMIANPAEVSSKEVGKSLGISPRTVDHHRARIFEKLEVRTLAEMLNLASMLRGSDRKPGE